MPTGVGKFCDLQHMGRRRVASGRNRAGELRKSNPEEGWDWRHWHMPYPVPLPEQDLPTKINMNLHQLLAYIMAAEVFHRARG